MLSLFYKLGGVSDIWADSDIKGDLFVNKQSNPQRLAVDILGRSRCAVMVGAVIADRHGIFSWGWNNEGDGWGQHAERHAISRANRKRLVGSSIYVAGERKRNGKIVSSRPCYDCLIALEAAGVERVYWRDIFDTWKMGYVTTMLREEI